MKFVADEFKKLLSSPSSIFVFQDVLKRHANIDSNSVATNLIRGGFEYIIYMYVNV